MSAPSPTFTQIRAQVDAVRQKFPQARLVGIHSPGRWTGNCCMAHGDDTYVIQQCDSPLAVRAALQDMAGQNSIGVVLTPLNEADLDAEVLTRFAKRRLFTLDNWQLVRELFGAANVDPRLTKHPWMAERFLEGAPPGGYKPAPGGFLDAETAWPIILHHAIGLDARRAELTALLAWSIDRENVRAWAALPDEFRRAASDWLATTAGPAAPSVLYCATTSELPDALAVGLAAAVVFHPAAIGRADRAAGRMEERYFGSVRLDDGILNRWSAAAAEVIQLALRDANIKSQQLKRADEIIQELGAADLAHLSDTSPLGFNQRLSAFSDSLVRAAKSRAAEALEAVVNAYRLITIHHSAGAERARVERALMAVRLIRWLANDRRIPRAAGSFTEAAQYQASEGAFLDWARFTLRCSETEDLAPGYARVFQQVTEQREAHARRFAELLSGWADADSPVGAVVPVERVLTTLVAPLAAKAPVLLIVVDGMSAAVCRELLSEVLQRDWTAIRSAESPATPVAAIATIPSVTEFSRTSLLCGVLRAGSANDETVGFRSHPDLLRECRKGHPPVLFHKASLQNADDAGLAPDLREEIASPNRQVVGVVLNAVDDYLFKNEQLNTRWTHDAIKLLPPLLHEARLARRLVVLVSDHGHILEGGAISRSGDGAARWRHDAGVPAQDEIRLTGSRVAIPNATSLIAPWSERIRYGMKRNGYHGGASPQEMVVPLVVLCPDGRCPQGWEEAPDDTPPWWDEPITVAPLESQHSVRPRPALAKTPFKLFDSEDDASTESDSRASEGPEWITRLLASPSFKEQLRLAGKAAPPVETLARFLHVLDAHDGRVTAAAVRRDLQCSRKALQASLQAFQRVLNVDGYPILTRQPDSAIIELDRKLLHEQFEIA